VKRVCIPVSNSFTVRSVLRSGVLDALLNDLQIEIVFFAPAEKLEYYKKEFALARVSWEVLPSTPAIEKWFWNLESASIHSETVKSIHWFYLRRKGTQIPLPVRLFHFSWKRICSHLGRFAWFRSLIRFAYGRVKNVECRDLLKRIKPDLIFLPTLIYGIEYALLREAKRLNIANAAMVSSWDNFYSKTFLRVFPDRLFAQTKSLKEQAIRAADFDEKKITLVGVPQYDLHFKKSGVVSRDEFLKEIGGDPTKKTILYALSGKVGMDTDASMLETLHEAMANKTFGDNVQVLIRPYPKSDFSEGRIEKMQKKYGFLTYSASGSVGTGKDRWEFDGRSIRLLLNTLAHSDVIVSTYSTFFIEAAIFDKPIVAVAFDGQANVDQSNSAERFFMWDHLKEIGKHNGIVRAKSKEEFIAAVKEGLAEPGKLHAGRQAIITDQCVFTDGNSSTRLAEGIRDMLKN
jgi:hypothetical protein